MWRQEGQDPAQLRDAFSSAGRSGTFQLRECREWRVLESIRTGNGRFVDDGVTERDAIVEIDASRVHGPGRCRVGHSHAEVFDHGRQFAIHRNCAKAGPSWGSVWGEGGNLEICSTARAHGEPPDRRGSPPGEEQSRGQHRGALGLADAPRFLRMHRVIIGDELGIPRIEPMRDAHEI